MLKQLCVPVAIRRRLQHEGKRTIHRRDSLGQPLQQPVVGHHGQVQGPVRLYMVQGRAQRGGNGLQSADLRLDLQDERVDRPIQPQTPEVAPVGIARVGTRLHTVAGGQRERAGHRVGIPGVGPACDVGPVDQRHHRGVGTLLPGPVAFAHVAVKEHAETYLAAGPAANPVCCRAVRGLPVGRRSARCVSRNVMLRRHYVM